MLANFPHHLTAVLNLLSALGHNSFSLHFFFPHKFLAHTATSVPLFFLSLYPPLLSSSVFMPSLSSMPDKVLTATHSWMAVNKRAKQKVNLSQLSLNTHYPTQHLAQNSEATNQSPHHQLHIIPTL